MSDEEKWREEMMKMTMRSRQSKYQATSRVGTSSMSSEDVARVDPREAVEMGLNCRRSCELAPECDEKSATSLRIELAGGVMTLMVAGVRCIHELSLAS